MRGEIKILERHVPGGFIDAVDQELFVLKAGLLGGYEAEHDLLAGRYMLERFEGAGTRRVELKVKSVDVLVGEQVRCDGVVATLESVCRVVVAAAHVRRRGRR